MAEAEAGAGIGVEDAVQMTDQLGHRPHDACPLIEKVEIEE